MEKTNTNAKIVVTIPTFVMLGILFVGLKLAGVIDWSWVWVTIPFWGVTGLFTAAIVSFLTVWLAIGTAEWIYKKFRRFPPRRKNKLIY